MFGPDIFGNAFDFNNDGKIDANEDYAQYMAYNALYYKDALTDADADYGLMRAGVEKGIFDTSTNDLDSNDVLDDEFSDDF